MATRLAHVLEHHCIVTSEKASFPPQKTQHALDWRCTEQIAESLTDRETGLGTTGTLKDFLN